MRFRNPDIPKVVCAIALILSIAPVCTAQTGAASTPDGGGDRRAACEVSLRTQYANVYLQSSAEYRACCYAIYSAAGYRLEEMLQDTDPAPARPAVVMDLDETVLDVSSFQTFLYVNCLKYTPELWAEFERRGVKDLDAVPGSRQFIARAESLGVTVVYLSNRNRSNQEWTAAGLAHVGIDTTGIHDRLFLKPDGGSSDKSSRREEIRSSYDVLMYLGDNLRDFSELLAAPELPEGAAATERRAAVEERLSAVDQESDHWGYDWFVLPNPVYGEWESLMGPAPEDILRPSHITAPGE